MVGRQRWQRQQASPGRQATSGGDGRGGKVSSTVPYVGGGRVGRHWGCAGWGGGRMRARDVHTCVSGGLGEHACQPLRGHPALAPVAVARCRRHPPRAAPRPRLSGGDALKHRGGGGPSDVWAAAIHVAATRRWGGGDEQRVTRSTDGHRTRAEGEGCTAGEDGRMQRRPSAPLPSPRRKTGGAARPRPLVVETALLWAASRPWPRARPSWVSD